jgi:hypothetical protein
MTAANLSIFALSPEDRRAEYAAAGERAMEAARDAAAEHKARKPDPRSIHDYRGYHTIGLVCVLVVKHRDKPASIECSRDGSAYPHIYLPTSKSIMQPETTDDFALICVPKWLAQKAELVGVTLPLSAARPWTDEQRKTWERLKQIHSTINTNIYFAKKRPASVLSRSAVA